MAGSSPKPEGIPSLLDTDLYKLTMACVVRQNFGSTEVTYSLTNRTNHMRLTLQAYEWLLGQIEKLGNLRFTEDEIKYLRRACKYFDESFLGFLEQLHLDPEKQVQTSFKKDENDAQAHGDLSLTVTGLWPETILYEIPLLALVSEAYFKFCDTDWNHDGQEENAYKKGLALLSEGCLFSEFGSRRRRDYATQEMVLRGLLRASKESESSGRPGKMTGTSNVHFAMKFDIDPIGTVAHEWFMGIAATSTIYSAANELGLRYWVDCFGPGVLGIALTDTFGTPNFLQAFKNHMPVKINDSEQHHIKDEERQIPGAPKGYELRTYAQMFNGVRQDSGDPLEFIKIMRKFYDEQGITDKKTIVFSDSLNVDLCKKYKDAAEAAGFAPSFGVGTFFTNDFKNLSNGEKSVPLNIVIKLSSAAGHPAVKISDNINKNTGDEATVEAVKQEFGYSEAKWAGGDEKTRWGS